MMDEHLATATKLADQLIEFAVTYGFQFLGALVFLFVGWKLSNWAGRKIASLAENKEIEPTLSRFIGNIVRILLIAILGIITLGNFGISIAPLIALAGASAFGATLALQGPLSNFGAGLSIILGRPFTIGDTITLGRTSGVVQEVKLPSTVLVGEDGERITIPNKEIVGKVIVNSEANRVVQTKIAVAGNTDVAKASAAIRKAIEEHDAIKEESGVQVGIHDFTYGGIILGARFWMPSQQYFELRYAINTDILSALRENGVQLLETAALAVDGARLSGDEEDPEDET